MRNPHLYSISQDFSNEYGAIDVVCFYEAEARKVFVGLETEVVDDQSAAILGKRRMYLEANHSGLNKFSGLQDPNFRSVCAELERMVLDSRKRSTRLNHEHAQSQKSLWLVPRSSTSIFTGRQDLLERMAGLLSPLGADYPSKQRSFVISGIGGTGKSETGLKFAEDNRHRYVIVFDKWPLY